MQLPEKAKMVRKMKQYVAWKKGRKEGDNFYVWVGERREVS